MSHPPKAPQPHRAPPERRVQTDRLPRPKRRKKTHEPVRCTRCLYDETTPSILFDADGVCNYCRIHDHLCAQYPAGQEGERRLREVAERIKRAGRKKPFDVVVGVSGGCDSSYLLYKAKELGLRPLAVHFDNT